MPVHVSVRSSAMRRSRRVAAIAVPLAIVLSSCGGDDDAGDSTPVVATSSPQDVVDHMLWSSDNEVLDEALAPPECSTAQPGGGRFFLPLWIAPGDSSTTCAVPSGSAVILNVGGTFCFDEPDLLAACQAEFEDPEFPVTLGAVSVNGERTDDLELVATPVFEWTPQPFWELGDQPLDTAFYGWYVTVTGLPDGEHTIVSEFEVGGDDPFAATVTHDLTVG